MTGTGRELTDRSFLLAELAHQLRLAIVAIRKARTLATAVDAPMDFQLIGAERRLGACRDWAIDQGVLAEDPG